MNIKRKVTWKDILNNFKSVYPRLSKEAQDYRPYNYMSIVVYLEDGTKVIYDDMAKRAKMLASSRRWRKEHQSLPLGSSLSSISLW